MLLRAAMPSLALVSLMALTVPSHAQGFHTDLIEWVAFTPDSHYALSASLDRTVGVWEVPSGRLVRKLEGHGDSINHVAVLAEGSRALSIASGGEARLWEIATGRCLLTLQTPEQFVIGAMPSSRQIIASDGAGGLRLWDTMTGQTLCDLPGSRTTPPALELWSIQVTPDSRLLAAGFLSGLIRVWDWATRRWVRDMPGHEDRVWNLAISPDGRTLLSLDGAQGRLWDLASGQCRTQFETLPDLGQPIFLPDGRHLVTGNPPQMRRVADGQVVWTREPVPREMGSPVAVSPDLKWLVTFCEDHGANETRYYVKFAPLNLPQ